MTTEMIGIHALIGIVAIGGFLVTFYWPWQAVWADIARQRVFEKRDAIFDLAQAGRISFESREYREVRIALEQIIRFAHAGTVPRIVLAALCAWCRGQFPKRSPIDSVIDRISDGETRKIVEGLVKEALRAVAFSMVVRSLPVILLFPVTIVAICVLALCHNVARTLGRAVDVMIVVESTTTLEHRGRRVAAA
jgi:hypothetical protein